MARKKKAAPQDIELVLASLQKEFGAGAIFQLGGTTLPDIEKTSSGSLLLDRALGGGYPVGRGRDSIERAYICTRSMGTDGFVVEAQRRSCCQGRICHS